MDDKMLSDERIALKKANLNPLISTGENDLEKNNLLGQESLHETENNCETKAAKIYQILAVMPVSFMCYIHGTTISYPMVAWEGMKSENNTLIADTGESTTDIAFIISLSSIGMIFGSFLTAPMNKTLGRRLTCILGVGVVILVSYILFIFAVNISMLYLSRFLMGFGLGASQSISTIYIAEVSSPSLRGNLAVIPGLTGCLGVYSCQILSYFLPWRPLSVLFSILCIPLLASLLWMPESPVFLLSRERVDEAHRVLRKLRGPNWNVSKEVKDIQKCAEGSGTEARNFMLGDLLNPTIFKPLIIAFSLMFFFQMSGIGLMITYAINIFKEVTSVDNFLATIFLGTALFISNIVTMAVAGKFPRRFMMLASSFGVALTLAILGFCFQVREWEKHCFTDINVCVDLTQGENSTVSEIHASQCELVQGTVEYSNLIFNDSNKELILKSYCSYNLGFLAIIDSMLYIFLFNLGYGTLVWMTVIEIIPPQIRSVSNGMAVGWVGILSFVIMFTFPFLMQSSFAGKWAFWMYSCLSFLGFIFIAFFVPETRGKTEEEIRAYFENNSKFRETPISKNSQHK